MSDVKKKYVACYWAGTIQLANGETNTMHCVKLSNSSIKIETETGLRGSKKSLLVIQAINNHETRTIKVICKPTIDILNEHDKHYITLEFIKISDASQTFINKFIKNH